MYTIFKLEDRDAAAAKVQELGGKLCLPPMTVEDIGRMAVVADPQGAVFALFRTCGGTNCWRALAKRTP